MFIREVFKLTVIISLTVITDALTVHLNVKNETCPEDNSTHYLFEGDYLHYKVPTNFHLQKAWCHDYNNLSRSQFGTQSVMPQTGIILFANISTDMSTTWKCTLLRKRFSEDKTQTYPHAGRNYTAIDCKIRIHVMTRLVNITTNGKLLGAQLVDHPLSEYVYAEYKYLYQDGEVVDTTCARANIVGGLRMEYKDANNKTLLNVKEVYDMNLTVRSLMRLDRNYSYLDCIYGSVASDHPNRKFLFRTYFIMKERVIRKNSISVWVDGLELIHRPYKESKNATSEFQYYYINGEELALECRVYHDRGDTEIIKSKKMRYNGSTITEHCSKNNDSVDIKFVSELSPNKYLAVVPRITGLRVDNILYQYTYDEREWRVHYQYTSRETLSLACVSAGSFSMTQASMEQFNFDLVWLVRGETIITSLQTVNTEYNIKKTNSRSITLGDADHMTNITCLLQPKKIRESSKVVVILHKMLPVVVQKTTENYDDTIQQETPTQNDKFLDSPHVSSNLGWYIAGATLGTVVIVVMVCIPMVCRYMKTKIRSRHENPHYENVDGDNRPIPIFPTQWNDYGESDSHYTKIDEGVMMINEYYQGIKHDRSSNVTYNTQDHYTEIIVPETGSGGYSKEYAEVMEAHQRRNDEYTNILSGGRYANTSASADYAEPAYCSAQPAAAARPVYQNPGTR